MAELANQAENEAAHAWGAELLAAAIERASRYVPDAVKARRGAVEMNAALYAYSCIALAIPDAVGGYFAAAQALAGCLADIISSNDRATGALVIDQFQSALNVRLQEASVAYTPKGRVQ